MVPDGASAGDVEDSSAPRISFLRAYSSTLWAVSNLAQNSHFFTDFYFQWLFFVLFCFICSFCLFPISARSLLCFLMRCFLHLSNFLRCPLIQSSGEGCSILFVFTWPLLMLECFWMYCVIPDCGLTVNKLYSRKSCQGVEGLFFRRDFCVCF